MLSSSSNDDNSDCLLKEREKVFHGWHFYFIFFLDVPCKAFIIGIIFSLKVISDTKLSSGLFLLVHWTAVLPEKKEKITYQSKTSGEPLCSLTNRKSLTVSSWSSDFSFFQFGELHWYILQEYLLGLFFLMFLLCVVLMLGGCYKLIFTGDSHIIGKLFSYPCDLIDPPLNVTMGRN